MAARAGVEGNVIWLEVPYEGRFMAHALGGKWNLARKRWEYPATPAAWESLMATFELDSSSCSELHQILSMRRYAAEAKQGSYIHYDFDTTPWDHQRGATTFAALMDVALLHCAMGSGKTKIVLDAARWNGHKKILVICPKNVISVWDDEIEKHAPGRWQFDPLNKGSIEKRAANMGLGMSVTSNTIFAVNYEASWQGEMGREILKHEWDLVVFDESQRIKGHKARQSRFAARIRAKQKLALTGTPLPHSPLDIFGQYRALDVGIFGTSWTRFQARYAVMGGYRVNERPVQIVSYQHLDELRAKMDKLRYHVTQEALTLPELMLIDRKADLEPQAKKHYKEIEEEFITEVDGGVVTVVNALAKLLRLQQVAAGFLPVEDEYRRVSNAKGEVLQELLEDLAGEYVVVFCRFHHDIDLVKQVSETLDRGGRNKCCGEISGRMNEYQEWKNGEFSTLVVQLQAGVGIDLTRARYAIFYTLGFSLGDYEQCLARIHRPGQRGTATVYHILARGTVDVKIKRALEARADIVRFVLGEYKEGREND